MRITLLSGIMEHPTPLAKGATVDRPDDAAEGWIARGLAVATPNEARAVQAALPPEAAEHAAAAAATWAAVGVVAAAVVEAAPAFADPPGAVVAPSPKRRRG